MATEDREPRRPSLSQDVRSGGTYLRLAIPYASTSRPDHLARNISNYFCGSAACPTCVFPELSES